MPPMKKVTVELVEDGDQEGLCTLSEEIVEEPFEIEAVTIDKALDG